MGRLRERKAEQATTKGKDERSCTPNASSCSYYIAQSINACTVRFRTSSHDESFVSFLYMAIDGSTHRSWPSHLTPQSHRGLRTRSGPRTKPLRLEKGSVIVFFGPGRHNEHAMHAPHGESALQRHKLQRAEATCSIPAASPDPYTPLQPLRLSSGKIVHGALQTKVFVF